MEKIHYSLIAILKGPSHQHNEEKSKRLRIQNPRSVGQVGNLPHIGDS
jgi:hypothetical protein